MVTYAPPKTRSWSENDYDKMIKDTRISLNGILKERGNTVIMGDFNCKEVCWEEMTAEGGEDSWGNVLLDMIMEHSMT